MCVRESSFFFSFWVTWILYNSFLFVCLFFLFLSFLLFAFFLYDECVCVCACRCCRVLLLWLLLCVVLSSVDQIINIYNAMQIDFFFFFFYKQKLLLNSNIHRLFTMRIEPKINLEIYIFTTLFWANFTLNIIQSQNLFGSVFFIVFIFFLLLHEFRWFTLK